MSASRVRFEHIDPILRVEDIQRALAFYVGVLGFEAAPWGDDDFTYVSRGELGIYLCRGAQGQLGTWVWIGVSDVRALFTTLNQQGIKIRQMPTPRPWALEMHVEDPDGHVLRFGSEPEQ